MESVGPETVEQFLERVRQAWDAADAREYARLFAADASYVIFMGDALFGRQAIERTHHEVFTKWQRGTRMIVRPLDVRLTGDATAVAVTAGGIGTGDAIGYDKFQTYTLRRRDHRWECVAFQNTEMSRRALETYRG
jgi:uncharacterized protein (TIGR02246 family)